MKQRTVRLILDCMMCDAMTPEFKAANAILLSIIRANDKSDAISHTMLAAVGKAFKENDARKSREALARITADLSKREKTLNDALVEARTNLAETTKRNTDAKAAIAQVKKDIGLFDKFVAAANAVKTNPKGLSKLSMYDLKLKKYGDFAKHIARINQLVSAKKDHAKATDALVKAVEKSKEKAKKETAKAEKELKESSERVKAWKDMEKMRERNIELFRKQQDDLRKMAAAIPDDSKAAPKGSDKDMDIDAKKKKALEIAEKIRVVANNTQELLNEKGEKLKEEAISLFEKMNAACKTAATEMYREAEAIGNSPGGYSISDDVVKAARKLGKIDSLDVEGANAVMGKAVGAYKSAMGKLGPEDAGRLKSAFLHAVNTFKANKQELDRLIEERKRFAATGIQPYFVNGMSGEKFIEFNDKQTYASIVKGAVEKISQLQDDVVKVLPVKPARSERWKDVYASLVGRINKYGQPVQMSEHDRQFFS